MIPFSIIVLAAVFILIAFRQIGGFRLAIWQAMLLGALLVLLAGQIGIQAAIKSINLEVIAFLFGMFVIGQAMEDSGYLSYLSYKIFRNAKSADRLVLTILLFFGLGSALLMNDTMAIIGTPVMIILARQHNLNVKLLLLALAFAVTTGSVVSPIGNPQNLLIAIHMENSFIVFFRYLFLPTMLSILACYLVLKAFYRDEFSKKLKRHKPKVIKDRELADLCKIALISLIALVSIKILSPFLGLNAEFKLTYIAIGAALPILIFSRRNIQIIRKIDWGTLVFFASMFILMESAWESNFFQPIIQELNGRITSIHMILIVSVLLSQVISNVPMVALYLPTIINMGAGEREFAALASGSTIAGNMLILGAASNVIIIQSAEKRGQTVSFWEFARIGIPLTVLTLFIYWMFLCFI